MMFGILPNNKYIYIIIYILTIDVENPWFLWENDLRSCWLNSTSFTVHRGYPRLSIPGVPLVIPFCQGTPTVTFQGSTCSTVSCAKTRKMGEIPTEKKPSGLYPCTLMLNGKRMGWGLETHNNEEVDSK